MTATHISRIQFHIYRHSDRQNCNKGFSESAHQRKPFPNASLPSFVSAASARQRRIDLRLTRLFCIYTVGMVLCRCAGRSTGFPSQIEPARADSAQLFFHWSTSTPGLFCLVQCIIVTVSGINLSVCLRGGSRDFAVMMEMEGGVISIVRFLLYSQEIAKKSSRSPCFNFDVA